MLRLIPVWVPIFRHLDQLSSRKSLSAAGPTEKACAYLIKYAQAEKTP